MNSGVLGKRESILTCCAAGNVGLTHPFVGALAFTGPALAAAFDAVDTNGDGAVTPLEFVAAYPDASENDFAAADVNGDGTLTNDEHDRAIETGILPAG